jgi:hypothetical protein
LINEYFCCALKLLAWLLLTRVKRVWQETRQSKEASDKKRKKIASPDKSLYHIGWAFLRVFYHLAFLFGLRWEWIQANALQGREQEGFCLFSLPEK